MASRLDRILTHGFSAYEPQPSKNYVFDFISLDNKPLIWRYLLLVRVCSQRVWPTSIVVETALGG